ncbi:hypothetical protein Nepgr_028817 [Nepenthes gracilis]|uniref:Vinorine synthase-like n=1 Tax=Nepenthes gracilis TaxID=150966 RepID=A0AAD3TDK4_NEPGR|nr:hypothetical protein Nepgr_028817 [Nepenthes gracilis]
MANLVVQRDFISREIIKPSTSTPPHPSTYKLSTFDQTSTSCYVPILLFYNNQAPNGSSEVMEISGILKNALSNILNRYYPFAGKIKGNTSIDCNDTGAIFSVFHLKNKLVDILIQPDLNILDILLPDALPWSNWKNGSLLEICVSFFNCGGFSIGMCISHKIADAYTIQLFLNDWAAMTKQPDIELRYPHLLEESAFPPGNRFTLQESQYPRGRNPVTRRFVFSPLKIANLKARVVSSSIVQNPTRVEIVTAILYRCLLKASKINSGSLSPSTLIIAVNLRPRVVPSLPYNSIGNAAWPFMLLINEEKKMKLDMLVAEMREGRRKFFENSKNMKGSQWFSVVQTALANLKSMGNLYICSSWCRFPFYEADFGWGKPTWVCISKSPFCNTIVLLDSKNGDGIEAWIILEEQVMSTLEGDDELLEHALLNPSIR